MLQPGCVQHLKNNTSRSAMWKGGGVFQNVVRLLRRLRIGKDHRFPGDQRVQGVQCCSALLTGSSRFHHTSTVCPHHKQFVSPLKLFPSGGLCLTCVCFVPKVFTSPNSHHFHVSSCSQTSALKNQKSMMCMASVTPIVLYLPVRPMGFSVAKRIRKHYTEEIEQVVAENALTIQAYAAALDCSEEEVADMVRRDTRMVTVFSKIDIINKINLLLHYGFKPPEILSRVSVFTRSVHVLQHRLQAMEPTQHYQHRIATLLLPSRQFDARINTHRHEVAIMGKHLTQASFLAELLQCSQAEVEALAGNKYCGFLLTLPPSRLQNIVSVLRSFGVSVEDMRARCLMLKCPSDIAQQRLELIRDAGVFDINHAYFSLINSETNFRTCFVEWVRNKKALAGYTNNKDFLLDRLECTEEDLDGVLTRMPAVMMMKSSNLKESLDVLQHEIGLSTKVILTYFHLVNRSKHRLQSRWSLLRGFQMRETTLVKELLMPEKKFVAKYGFDSQ